MDNYFLNGHILTLAMSKLHAVCLLIVNNIKYHVWCSGEALMHDDGIRGSIPGCDHFSFITERFHIKILRTVGFEPTTTGL